LNRGSWLNTSRVNSIRHALVLIKHVSLKDLHYTPTQRHRHHQYVSATDMTSPQVLISKALITDPHTVAGAQQTSLLSTMMRCMDDYAHLHHGQLSVCRARQPVAQRVASLHVGQRPEVVPRLTQHAVAVLVALDLSRNTATSGNVSTVLAVCFCNPHVLQSCTPSRCCWQQTATMRTAAATGSQK
jgi:hypothetical protein